MSNDAINPCPCGATPTQLHYIEGVSCKHGFVAPDCCGTWMVEFRTEYNDPGPELDKLMREAWNEAPRAIDWECQDFGSE